MKKLIIVVIRFVVLVASTLSGTKLTPLPVSIVEPTLTGGSRLLEPEALSGLTGNQKTKSLAGCLGNSAHWEGRIRYGVTLRDV